MAPSHRTVPDARNGPTPAAGREEVVLCGPDGAAIGTADKVAVHGVDTPLHLAFSCYVFDVDGRVLVTRRAYDKRTFPGVRTNSCCGHPAPGEAIDGAVHRRVRDELGLDLTQLTLVLPAFRYRAVAANGVVENELCPVFRAVAEDPQLRPDPVEVAAAWWVPWADYVANDYVANDYVANDYSANDYVADDYLADDDVAHHASADPLSAWGVDQLRALNELGPDPRDWPAADPLLLPAAASWAGV